MRVTMHSGRGSAKHNDHNSDVKNAEWDKSKTKDNYIWTCMNTNEKRYSAKDGELAFYESFYGKTLEKQNKRYKSKGQYGYVRSMNDWLKARQHQPNETILQIGDMDEHADGDTLWNAAVKFINWKSSVYNSNYRCISLALHVDEGTPHIHVREAWFSHDAEGLPVPGIKAGLREMGVPLPDANAPEGKNNYRKAVVDAECRSKWQEICKSMGLTIETQPKERSVGHMGKDAYHAYDEAMKRLEAEKAKYSLEAEKRLKSLSEAFERLSEREDALQRHERELVQRENNLQSMELNLNSVVSERVDRAIQRRQQADAVTERSMHRPMPKQLQDGFSL